MVARKTLDLTVKVRALSPQPMEVKDYQVMWQHWVLVAI